MALFWNSFLSLFLIAITPAQIWDGRPETFTPKHRLTGVGVDRRNLTPEIIEARTRAMIDSQTFAILRDPRAVAGAQRITSPGLTRLFKDAERQSGVPARLLSAISYLESWGDAKAESPTGPRGIMQVSTATARTMGLKIVYKTRYKVSKERRTVKRRGRSFVRTVKVRTPYTVLVRDERLQPERAIPAAARHLARMQAKFGGMDWAIFAYHCGEGCVGGMRSLTDQADGLPKPVTVAKMFFGGSPAFNRDLNSAVREQMLRDYSPTYWFRVMRAQELLDLYREEPRAFRDLAATFRYSEDSEQRAPHRLAIWLRESDLVYRSCEDIRRDEGRKLRRVLDDADYYGFRVRTDMIASNDPANRESYLQASPAALGTLIYIAFETRRLHQAMHPRGEKYVPLEVTSLIRPLDSFATLSAKARNEAMWHCTGQVFDIDFGKLPRGETEALRFVLDDMGWAGYLGFVEEVTGGDMHIGAAPSARDFFTGIYEEALAAAKK